MFVSPIRAIEEGWITHPDCKNLKDWEDRKYLSPNAIDFTVDRLFSVNPSMFFVSEDEKIMRGETEENPSNHVLHKEDVWWIRPNTPYGVLSNMYVEIPEGFVSFLVPRSTFTRNGLFTTSGFYDQGYKGHIGCTLHSRNSGDSYIVPGTRIGQIAFVQCENSGIMYGGGYNHSHGTHWSDK